MRVEVKHEPEIRVIQRFTDVDAMTSNVLNELFESFQLVLPYDRVGYAVWLPDEDIVRAAWVRSVKPGPVKLKPGFQLPMNETSLSAIAESGRPRVIDDLREYYKQRPASQSTKLALAEGVRSNLTVPVKDHDELVGFLFFSSFRPDTYRDIDKTALLGLARIFSATVTLERDRHREHLRVQSAIEQAHHDPLTGALNRLGLVTRLKLLSIPGTPARRFALAFVDVNGMKQINDSFGHSAGDTVLQRVATILQACVRKHDYVARIGGDEFIIVADITDSDETAATRIATAIEHRLARAQGHPPVSASIGIRTFESEDFDLDAVISEADAAMYEMKRQQKSAPRPLER